MEYHILVIKVSIDKNDRATYKKQKETDEKYDKTRKLMENLMDKFYNPSSNRVETNNPQYSIIMVHTNRKVPPLEGVNSHKIGVMYTLKHDISSPKSYELVIKTKLKGYTDMYLKNFYNHISICFNLVTRLINDLIPACWKIKRHFYFHKHFVPELYNPSYSCNDQTYNSLGHSILVNLKMTPLSNLPWNLKYTIFLPPTLTKYWNGLSYPDLYILEPLI